MTVQRGVQPPEPGLRPRFGARRVQGLQGVPPVRGVAAWLFFAAVFCMPMQLEIVAFKSVVGSRFPPGDVLLLLSILAAPTIVRFRRSPTELIPLALIATLAWGAIIALVYAGTISNHAMRVKLFGAFALVAWCLVTAAYTRKGHGWRIVQVWLLGMAVWGVVAWVDWRVANILPFLEAKLPSRFGGMQFDPNNAGAAYAVASIMMWQGGTRMFRRQWVRGALTLLFLVLLFLTYSRGGYIGLVAAATGVLILRPPGPTRGARIAAVVVVLGLASVLGGFVDDAFAEFERRPDTLGSRGDLSADAIDSFVESGGIGIGLGTHFANSPQIVHNTTVWLLIEMSFVGIAFLVVMTLVPAHAMLRLRSVDRDYAFTLLGAHFVMIVTSVGIEALYQRQWWMIVGLCSMLARVNPRPGAPVVSGERY